MANRCSAAAVLHALGDPTRQALFERLAAGPASVGLLAKDLPVTRSAVSQHLRVLKEAQLVSDSADGTRRIYRIDPRGVGAMRDWLDEHWKTAMAAFQALADAEFEEGDNA